MNADQNMTTSPAINSGDRDEPSIAHSVQLSPQALPTPVAASAHANAEISANPIAEWLDTVSPEDSKRWPKGRHRKNLIPPRG